LNIYFLTGDAGINFTLLRNRNSLSANAVKLCESNIWQNRSQLKKCYLDSCLHRNDVIFEGLMNKSTLRKKYLDQRLALGKEQYDPLNSRLIDQLFRSVDLSNIEFLHIFLPITKFKEVDTWQIIDRIMKEFPQIKLVIPKVVGDDLEHYLFEGKEQLAIDKWGIPEPAYGKLMNPDQIDMVLVPLVVADQLGNRIGYGKGYYDKFLAECKPQTQKIGLSLLPLSGEPIEYEESDMRLDGCVTPESYYPY